MQVLNTPSLSGMWGEALGTGLGGALQQIAQAKVRDLNSVKTYNYLKEMPGFSQEQAKAISLLDPSMQELAIKSAQNAYASEAIGSYLNRMYPNQNGVQSNNQQQGPINLTESFKPNNTQPLSTQQQVRTQQIRPSVQPTMQKASERAASEQMFENPNAFPQVTEQPQPNRVDLSNAPIDFRAVPANQLMQLAGLGMQAKAAQHKNALDEAKLEQGERGLALKERLGEGRLDVQRGRLEETKKKTKIAEEKEIREANKEWRELDSKYATQYKNAKKLKEDYKLMRLAASSGNYRQPNMTNLYKQFGIDEYSKNPETQLIDKLSAGIVAAGAQDMGSSATVYAEQILARSNPGRHVSPEVLSSLCKIYENNLEYKEKESEAFFRIAKENKGKIVPGNIESLIQEEMIPYAEQRDAKNALAEQMAINIGNGQAETKLPSAKGLPDWQQKMDSDGNILTKVGGNSNPRWVKGLRLYAKSLNDRA